MFVHRFPVMGTTAELSIVGATGAATKKLTDAAETRLHDLEARWSRFRDDSELAAINRAAGRPTIVSAETFRLIDQAVDAWRRTAGRFDPTLGETMARAGYDRPLDHLDRSAPVPGATTVPAPTPTGIELNAGLFSVLLPAGVQLDLGGIAKGAAADLVAAEILDAGADGCSVNIGGDLRVAGAPPRPEGWRINLACPGSDDSVVVSLVAGAVCTSTSLLRRWTGADGEEHHLRDPATGRPLERGLVSASILGATAVQAEVLTKVVLATGLADVATVLDPTGATGVVVDTEGTLHALPGFDAFTPAAPAVAGPVEER